jgi:ABC-type glycerol-3-phosphate transport system substrate-binding protein
MTTQEDFMQHIQPKRHDAGGAPASRPLTRRRFLQVSGTAVTGIVFAACAAPAAPAATESGAASESITIQVLNNNWGELYNGLMEKIGDDYVAANPNVVIEWTFEQEWRTKLLTLVAGGTPPDAAYTNWQAQANLAQKNTFAPLDSYVEATGLSREDFVISMYDACVWDGTLYAIPGGADYIALFWNKDVYADAGLDPETPPATADELLEQAEAMLQVDGDGNITRVGYIPEPYHYMTWVYLNGGEFYDEENQVVTANSEINVQVFEWMMEYIRLLDINKLAAFNSSRPGFYEAGNPFATKQAGTRFDGFWYYDALDQFAPDINYGVGFIPTPSGREEERANYLIQGWMYGLPAGSAQPDAAWDFVRYAFIDEAARMGYLTLNGPCVKNSFADFEAGLREQIGEENRISPYLDVFTSIGEAGTKHWPNMPVNAFYYDEIVRIWDFVTRGEMTVQAGLDEVTQNVQAELEKAA